MSWHRRLLSCCYYTILASSRSLYVVVRLSVVCLSVTFVRPTQAIEIFGDVSMPFGILASVTFR